MIVAVSSDGRLPVHRWPINLDGTPRSARPAILGAAHHIARLSCGHALCEYQHQCDAVNMYGCQHSRLIGLDAAGHLTMQQCVQPDLHTTGSCARDVVPLSKHCANGGSQRCNSAWVYRICRGRARPQRRRLEPVLNLREVAWVLRAASWLKH